MRQGNDVGTQYRSAIYWDDADQQAAALASRERYEAALRAAGHGDDHDRDRAPAGPFYYAEDYHQQYLAQGTRTATAASAAPASAARSGTGVSG